MFSRPLFVALVPIALVACGDPDSPNAATTGTPPDAPPKEIVWAALPTDGAPSARYSHTAVWTGSKMIVWGGEVEGAPSATNTGGIYDPASRTWKPTSTTGAPAPRFSHTAVWTGSKMLVWGGFGVADYEQSGGIYDPETDTWAPMSTSGQASPRNFHTAVWTGSKMVVWGGGNGPNVLGTGGMYDPAADTWVSTNAAASPKARRLHGAAWSGSEMLIWGGADGFDWFNVGAIFNPEGTPSGVWTRSTNASGAPPEREQATVAFTGKAFIVWGGWTGGANTNTGGLWDPAENTWSATSETDAPSQRAAHIGLWAGNHLVIWGGCRETPCNTSNVEGDGGQFVPGEGGGTWQAIPAQASLSPRYGATAVYTGGSVIVWGGRTEPSKSTNTGAEAPL